MKLALHNPVHLPENIEIATVEIDRTFHILKLAKAVHQGSNRIESTAVKRFGRSRVAVSRIGAKKLDEECLKLPLMDGQAGPN